MKGIFHVSDATQERGSLCLSGTVSAGTLASGMESRSASEPIVIIEIRDDADKPLGRAERQTSIVVIAEMVENHKDLVGMDLEFDEKRSISLKKGIFVAPEPTAN